MGTARIWNLDVYFSVFLILIAHRRSFICVWLNHGVFQTELPGWGSSQKVRCGVSKALEWVEIGEKSRNDQTCLGGSFCQPVLGCWRIQVMHFWAAVWGGSTDCGGKEWMGGSRKELKKKPFVQVKSDLQASATSLPGEPCAPWSAAVPAAEAGAGLHHQECQQLSLLSSSQIICRRRPEWLNWFSCHRSVPPHWV